MPSKDFKILRLFLCLCLAWAGWAQAYVGPSHIDDPGAQQVHGTHAKECSEVKAAGQGAEEDSASAGACTACAAPCVAGCTLSASVIASELHAIIRAGIRLTPYSPARPLDVFPDADLRPPRLFS